MRDGWEIFTRFEPWSGSTAVFVTFADYQGARHVANPPTFTKLTPGMPFDSPTLSTHITEGPSGDPRDFLQAALDAAWELGLRPKGFADVANEIAAVRYHLEDMRKLAKLAPLTPHQRPQP